MVKKILSIVLWVITGAALIFLFVVGRMWYLETPLKGVNIQLERSHANGFVQKDSLLASAESICGLARHNKIADIDLLRVERLLADNPWIEEGSAYIDLDEHLIVKAREYEPVLRVYGSDGRSVYVTAEGKILPSSPYYTPHLIIASGHFTLPSPNRQAHVSDTNYCNTGIAEALAIAQAVESDEYLAGHVGQIYKNADNDFELAVNNLPAKVVIGDLTDLGHKLARLRTLLERYINTEELLGYKSLNLKYKNQIVCTKK